MVGKAEQRGIGNEGLNQREGVVMETVGGKNEGSERRAERRGDREGRGS